SGATTGFAGAQAWASTAAGGPIDAVLALGDLAGRKIRKPWVVGWPSSAGPPALRLERTVQAAVRAESGRDAGGPHALGQWARRAFPFSVSEQGPVAAGGLPAVLLSVSGERGPPAGEPVSERRLVPVGAGAGWAAPTLPATSPPPGGAAAGGLAAAAGLLTCGLAAVAWLVNPYAAALLLPAAHLWLFVAAPGSRLRGPWAVAAVA